MKGKKKFLDALNPKLTIKERIFRYFGKDQELKEGKCKDILLGDLIPYAKEAPEPDTINWENLKYSRAKRNCYRFNARIVSFAFRFAVFFLIAWAIWK